MLCPAPAPLSPYVPSVDPGECCPIPRTLSLCDLGAVPPTPFIRTQLINSVGGIVVTIDTEVDGVTPYVVIGPVDECCPCEPTFAFVTRPRVQHIVGVGSFALPAGALAVTVIVRDAGVAGSVTVTTNDGVTPLRDGEVVEWSVVRDQDSGLTGVWQVDATNAGDEVLIVWTEQV